MENETKNTPLSPPRLTDAFITGFNTVANNVYLIIFPVIFDIFLWFGPHIKIKNLLQPIAEEFFKGFSTTAPPEMLRVVQTSQEMWVSLLDRLNLMNLLHSYPVGIFSIMIAVSPLENPLGKPQSFEISSVLQFFAIWLAFALIGLLLGSLYFGQVARCCHKGSFSDSLHAIGRQTSQVLVLSIILILILILLSLPSSIILSIMALINLLLAQIVLIFVFLVYIWLLFPLVFSPHGIFYFHQKALSAILTSARVVRYSLPNTTLFILLIVLFAQGINLIWTIPPTTSWMMLIGIIGHAFTSTSLLASSFIYYRNNYQWLQENLKRLPTQRINV